MLGVGNLWAERRYSPQQFAPLSCMGPRYFCRDMGLMTLRACLSAIEIEPGQEMNDWWRVAAMVTAVIIGVALVLYVGVEWAAAM